MRTKDSEGMEMGYRIQKSSLKGLGRRLLYLYPIITYFVVCFTYIVKESVVISEYILPLLTSLFSFGAFIFIPIMLIFWNHSTIAFKLVCLGLIILSFEKFYVDYMEVMRLVILTISSLCVIAMIINHDVNFADQLFNPKG